MRLFFMRHGQAEHNRLFIINETNQHLSNLTEQGFKEVEKSAAQLRQQLAKIDIIYCSPLVRCQQTAKIINEHYAVKIPIKIDKRLAEFKTGFNNEWAFIWSIRLFLSRNRLSKKFKEGQSILEAALIAKKFCQMLEKKHPQETVLIVAHLHTFQMICAYLYNRALTVPWRKMIYLETAGFHEFKPDKTTTSS